MLSKIPAEDFQPRFEVVSCFVQVLSDEGKEEILLLLRPEHKPQPNTWGIPAGKQDPGEERNAAMLRELFEETGIVLDPSDLAFLDSAYVRFPNLDFIQHIYCTRLATKAAVRINPEEHKEFRWVDIEQAHTLDLIQDLDACIKILQEGSLA